MINITSVIKREIKYSTVLGGLLSICCCSSNNQTKIDKFLKDTEWSVWRTEDLSVEIFVSNNSVKQGFGFFTENGVRINCEYNLDAFVGIAVDRPWKMKIECSQDEHIAHGFDLKKINNKKGKQLNATDKQTSFLMTNYEWTPEDFDVRYLRRPVLNNTDLGLEFRRSSNCSNKYISDNFTATYLDKNLTLSIEDNKVAKVFYEENSYYADYSRNGNQMILEFNAQTIFPSNTIVLDINKSVES